MPKPCTTAVASPGRMFSSSQRLQDAVDDAAAGRLAPADAAAQLDRLAGDDLRAGVADLHAVGVMIQAIVCSSVPMSGAMTSMRGPMMRQHLLGEAARQPLLLAACDSAAGSQAMPPLAPPKGRFMMPHFHVIHMARAATSPRSTCGA